MPRKLFLCLGCYRLHGSSDSQALPDVSLEAKSLLLESHRLDDKVNLEKVRKGRLLKSSKLLKGRGLQRMVSRFPNFLQHEAL